MQEPTTSAPSTNNTASRPILPFHPFLFAAFPLLALYSLNIGQIPIEQIYRPVGLALLAALAVWTLLGLLTGNLRKSALATSVLMLLFFSYGHLVNLSRDTVRPLVAPVCLIAAVGMLFGILRTRRSLQEATRALNLTALLLLAPSVWTIGLSLWSGTGSGRAPSDRLVHADTLPAVSTTHRHRTLAQARSKDQPDVYYIILDAYGRDDSLRAFYDYDNTPFLKELEKRGFYIARHSRANYDQTGLCVASALNMNYLDELADPLGTQGANMEPVRQMIDDNEVAAVLSKRGYHFVSVSSGASQTRIDTADLLLKHDTPVSTFENSALGLTALSAAPQTERSRYDEHRKSLLSVFENLNSVPQLPYSKFVFAHVLAPHPPFVLGENGEAVYPTGAFDMADASWLLGRITPEQYKSRYIAQLKYVNKRALEAIDAILSKSRTRPVIILQGDHGSRMNLDWDSLDRTDLREPFSILNAYYVPDKVRKSLYDTITPVNSFRLVLSNLFGEKYRKISDRSFYSTASEPLHFSEVTKLIPKFNGQTPVRSRPLALARLVDIFRAKQLDLEANTLKRSKE